MDQNHSEDQHGEMRSTQLGDPNNDQALAYIREDLRDLLDNTIYPIIDQAEAQNAGLSEMMAVLVPYLIEHEDFLFTRPRMAALLALLLFAEAARERVEVSEQIDQLIKSATGDVPD